MGERAASPSAATHDVITEARFFWINNQRVSSTTDLSIALKFNMKLKLNLSRMQMYCSEFIKETLLKHII
jgi:hypothetical protein